MVSCILRSPGCPTNVERCAYWSSSALSDVCMSFCFDPSIRAYCTRVRLSTKLQTLPGEPISSLDCSQKVSSDRAIMKSINFINSTSYLNKYLGIVFLFCLRLGTTDFFILSWYFARPATITWIFYFKTVLSTTALCCPYSASAAWYFTLAQYTISKSYADNRSLQQASFPVASERFKIHLDECWFVLRMNFHPFKKDHLNRAAYTTARHSRCEITRSFSWSVQVRGHNRKGSVVLSSCFHSGTQSNYLSQLSVSKWHYLLLFGIVNYNK